MVLTRLRYLLAASSLLLSACGASDVSSNGDVNPVNIQLSPTVRAKLTVGYVSAAGNYYAANDDGLGKLADRDPATWWTSGQDGCRGTVFRFAFDNPVYLKSITLTYHGDTLPLKVGGTVSESDDVDSAALSERDVALGPGSVKVVNFSGGYYWRVLPVGVLNLDSVGCNSKGGKLSIEEIKFEFSKGPSLVPELSMTKLKARLKATAVWDGAIGASNWHFGPHEKDLDKERFLALLMCYGLKGDAKADSLFRAYVPPGADSSEDESRIEDWYDDALHFMGATADRSRLP